MSMNKNENGGFLFLRLLLLLFSAIHSMPLAAGALLSEVHAVFPVIPLQDGPLAMMANFHPPDRCNFHHHAPGKTPNNRVSEGQNATPQMAPVEFRSGQKYLISTEALGSGATGQVFHAILIGNKWKTSEHRPTECVAIKVGDDEIVTKEAETLHQIWLPQKYAPFNKTPQNILRFIRSESFYAKPYNPQQAEQKKKGKRRKQTAIVMELGMQNLAEYWAEAMPIVMGRFIFCDVDEGMLIRIMRQIGLALVEVHQREYLFVDLKWENVMVMPGSPTPKELCNENGDKLLLKITDFGAALKFRPKNRRAKTMRLGRNAKLMATPFFRAPEIFDEVTEKEIGPGTDIFSLGRLMLLLAVQTPHMRKWVAERGLLEIIREWYGKGDEEDAGLHKTSHDQKQTQAEGQKSRPSALDIVEHCNSLLNHQYEQIFVSPSGPMTPGGGQQSHHRRTASMVGMVRRQFSHSFRRFKSFSMEMNPF